MIRTNTVLLLAACLALPGCGKELTAGGLKEGEVNAVATDSGEASASRPSYALSPGAPSASSVAALEGTIAFDAAVSLVAESGAIVPITAGATPVDVAIGSAAPVPFATDRVPEGIYPAVRIVFTDVEAQVVGLLLGGVSFSGTVRVGTEGQAIEITAQVPVRVREEAPVTITLDLDSGEWLGLAQIAATLPPTAIVPAAAFRAAVDVTAEPSY